MDKRESLIDKLIRESMERGEFDDLTGKGQPIDLSENPFEDPELRTVHRLLRNAGFAPAWLEERKDIDAEFERARATLVRANQEFRQTVAEINRRVRIYNLKAPAVVFHRKTIDAEALIRELEKIE